MPFAQLYWPARSMSNTLGNKEFDEEDFYVSGPTNLTYTAQPITGKVNKTLGIVRVALLDGFGNVMTMDTGADASTITVVAPGAKRGRHPELCHRPIGSHEEARLRASQPGPT